MSELLERSESGSPDEKTSTMEELGRRRHPAVAAQLLELARDESFAHRHLAARALSGFLYSIRPIRPFDELNEVQIDEIRTTLSALVEDPDERLQLAALASLAIDWGPRRLARSELPVGTAGILRWALRAQDHKRRASAAVILRAIGPAMNDLRDDLVQALEEKPPDGAQPLLLLALQSVSTESDRLPTSRLVAKYLADPDQTVRQFALMAIDMFDEIDPGAFAALGDFHATATYATARHDAILALAKHAREPEAIATAIELLLANLESWRKVHRPNAPSALARLVARSPRGIGTDRAIRKLTELAARPDDPHRDAAPIALVRIAAARRDLDLLTPRRDVFRSHLDTLRDEELDGTYQLSPADETALAAAVVLARWPAAKFPATDIRPLLERLSQNRFWWSRKRAQQLLGELDRPQ
ncbi:MAG: hypothetical protein NXI31_10880 [bacterium]|nr:hypothetical protein [bacterium]